MAGLASSAMPWPRKVIAETCGLKYWLFTQLTFGVREGARHAIEALAWVPIPANRTLTSWSWNSQNWLKQAVPKKCILIRNTMINHKIGGSLFSDKPKEQNTHAGFLLLWYPTSLLVWPLQPLFLLVKSLKSHFAQFIIIQFPVRETISFCHLYGKIFRFEISVPAPAFLNINLHLVHLVRASPKFDNSTQALANPSELQELACCLCGHWNWNAELQPA